MSVLFYMAAFGGLVVFDRWSKFLVLSFRDSEGFFIGNFFGIKLFENSGAVFGLPKISPFFEIIIIIVGLILSGAAISAWRKKEKIIFIGLVLIIFGGFSNFLDRLLYGFVIDMIHIGLSVWNIADVMIGTGFIIAAVGLFKNYKIEN